MVQCVWIPTSAQTPVPELYLRLINLLCKGENGFAKTTNIDAPSFNVPALLYAGIIQWYFFCNNNRLEGMDPNSIACKSHEFLHTKNKGQDAYRKLGMITSMAHKESTHTTRRAL